MKKIYSLTILLIIILIGGIAKAQTIVNCATEESYRKMVANDPVMEQRRLDLEANIKRYIANRNKSTGGPQAFTVSPNTKYIIPVVIHIIRDPADTIGSDVSDARIDSQMVALNTGFLGTNIQFCLATNPSFGAWSNGKAGVTRHISATTLFHDTPKGHADLKNVSYFPPQWFLNIWVVTTICLDSNNCTGNGTSVLGIGPYPIDGNDTFDGVVMKHDVFGSNRNGGNFNLRADYDLGLTLVHEVGHYLFLYHTFQGGCTDSSAAHCASAGDYICDTPPIKQQSDCNANARSCDGTQAALYHNFMDYGVDACKSSYTPMQIQRMQVVLDSLRSELATGYNLNRTGVQCVPYPLVVDFSVDSQQKCATQNATFQTSTHGSKYQWHFPGGIPDTSSLQSPPPINYATPGAYDVILTVTDNHGNAQTQTKKGYMFITNCTLADKTHGNWYFGGKAGLNFSTGVPVPVTTSAMTVVEGCATVSDANGNLLFYTDAVRVYNRNGDTITTKLVGNINGGGAQQGVLAVPYPGHNNQYAIFTVPDGFGGTNNGLNYTIIDMTLNGGLGGVSGTMNIPAPIPAPGILNQTSEHLSAIPHCNGNDYWIIVHSLAPGYTNKLLAYQLSSTGLNTPVSSTTVLQGGETGHIKAAPTGRLVAISNGGSSPYQMYIYDFDRQTGIFTDIVKIPNTGSHFAISPNSKLLYTLTDAGAMQYDISNAILSKQVPVGTEVKVGNFKFLLRSIALAADNKLYLSSLLGTSLDVINFPDSVVSISKPNACGYTLKSVTLPAGSQTYSEFPNDVNATKVVPVAKFEYAFNSCFSVHFHNLGCAPATGLAWDFGDGGTSTQDSPSHTYASPGRYKVIFTINNNAGISRDTHIVVIHLPDAPVIVGLRQDCFSGITNYSAIKKDSIQYTWTFQDAFPSSSNSLSVDVSWKTSGIKQISLTATNTFTQCSTTSTINVQVYDSLAAHAGADVTIGCNTFSTQLGAGANTATGGKPGYSYAWHTKTDNTVFSTSANPVVSPPSTTIYILEVIDNLGCNARDTVVVNVNNSFVFNLTQNGFIQCYGQKGQLHLSMQGGVLPYTYVINSASPVSTNSSDIDVPNLTPGVYSVTVTDAAGCFRSAAIIIASPNQLTINIGHGNIFNTCANVPIVLGGANQTQGGTLPYSYKWQSNNMTIPANTSPNPTITLLQNTRSSFYVTVTDANGCSASDSNTLLNDLVAFAGDNQTICYGNQAVLGGYPSIIAPFTDGLSDPNTATGGSPPYTYQWSGGPDPGQFDNTTSPQPKVYVLTNNTQYTVTVTDAHGCIATSSTTVFVNSPTYDYSGDGSFTGVTKITTDANWNSGQTIKVRGVLVVDYGTTLSITNGTRVEFTPEPNVPQDLGLPFSGIVVYPTATLNITNNAILTYSNDCQQMWDGVQVWGQDSSTRGVCNINTGGTVANARAGVSTYRVNAPFTSSQGDYGSGLLVADGAKFNANYVGVAFSGFTLPHNQSRIQNSTFTSGPMLDIHQYGKNSPHFAHVLLRNVYGVGIEGGNTFTGFGSLGVFAGIGVLSYDAGYDVAGYVGTTFQQSTPNYFINLNKGVDAYSTGGTGTKIRIRNNHFMKVGRGITTNNTRFDEIIGNTVDTLTNFSGPIEGDTTGNTASYGIFTHYSEGYVATDNIIGFISRVKPIFPNPKAYGIVARGAGTNNASQVYRNTVTGNLSVASQMEQGNTLLQLGCNQFTGNNTYDWAVTSGVLGNQGGCNTITAPAGNVFGSACGVPDKQIHLNTGVSGFQYSSHAAIAPTCISPSVNLVRCGLGAGIYTRLTACPDNKTSAYTPPPIAPAPRPCYLCPITQNIQTLINQINNTTNGLLRSILSNQAISGLLDNNNVQGVLQILGASGNVSDIKIMVPTYLAKQNCDAARQLLAQIPSTATTGASAADNVAYHQLFDMLVNVCSSGRVIAQLTPAEKNVIVNVAVGNTQAAVNAQAILASINKTVYNRVPEGIQPLFGSGRMNEEQANEALPAENGLIAIPNPFNATTTIKYQLKDYASNVTMLVFDVTGRKIKEYHLDDKQMGEVGFEAGNNQSGLYICQLWNAGKLITVQKLVLMQ